MNSKALKTARLILILPLLAIGFQWIPKLRHNASDPTNDVFLVKRLPNVRTHGLSFDGQTLVGTNLQGQIISESLVTGSDPEINSPQLMGPDSGERQVLSPNKKIWAIVDGPIISLRQTDAKPVVVLQRGRRHVNRAKYEVVGLSFSPDSSLIAALCEDGYAYIWRTEGGSLVRSLPYRYSGKSDADYLTFAKDNQIVALTDGGKSKCVLRLWDIGSGKPLHCLRGDTSRVRAISFSPKEPTVSCINSSGILQTWNLKSGKLRRKLQTANCESAAFSASGDIVVVTHPQASRFKNAPMETIEFLHATTGQSLGTIPEPWFMPGLTLSGDGKTLGIMEGGLIIDKPKSLKLEVWRLNSSRIHNLQTSR